MDCKKCILCQKDSSAPLLYPSRNRDDPVCEYVNLKNKIEEFQRSEVPFPIGIPVHWNGFQEGDGIIQLHSLAKSK